MFCWWLAGRLLFRFCWGSGVCEFCGFCGFTVDLFSLRWLFGVSLMVVG